MGAPLLLALLAPAVPLAVVCAPGVARAQQQPRHGNTPAEREARERFQRGVDLTDEHNYSAAMTEFQRAYELTHNPVVLFNISATHEALGNFVEAREAMQRFLAEAPAAARERSRADAEAALARLRGRIGTIVVALDTPGLTVRVDGIERPTVDARRGLDVSAGRRRLSLAAPGYESRELDLDVAGATRLEVRDPLTAVQTTVAINSNVAGAEVLVDGRVVATTPVASPIPVAEGVRQLEVRRAGYNSYTTAVDARGRGAQVNAQLTWADPVPEAIGARLVVHTNVGAAVAAFLDGHRISLEGNDRVPPGPHRLRVERTDYFTANREVNLPPGQRVTVDVQLEPTPGYRAGVLERGARQRVIGGVILGIGAAVAIGTGIWFGVSLSEFERYQPELNRLAQIVDRCPPGGACMDPLHPGRNAITDYNTAVDNSNNAQTPLIVSGVTVALGLASALTGIVVISTAPTLEQMSPARAPAMRARLRLPVTVRPLLAPRFVGLGLAF